MITALYRRPPSEFAGRFRWESGYCFKCERVTEVASVGTLTVGGQTASIAACYLCAWRLERQHHHARLAYLRVHMTALDTSGTRRTTSAPQATVWACVPPSRAHTVPLRPADITTH